MYCAMAVIVAMHRLIPLAEFRLILTSGYQVVELPMLSMESEVVFIRLLLQIMRVAHKPSR